MSAQTSTMAAASRRRLRPRHLWIVPGLAIAIYANIVAGEHDLGLVPLLLFGILPQLPFSSASVSRPSAVNFRRARSWGGTPCTTRPCRWR